MPPVSPTPPAQPHPTHRYLLWLALLLIIAGLAYLFWPSLSGPAQPQNKPSGAVGFPQSAPAPTEKDYVTAQKGFQYLVSYTGVFAPAALSVKKGETVRFTNNSDAALQLSLPGAPALARGQYFEYTFTATATVTGGAGSVQVTVK